MTNTYERGLKVCLIVALFSIAAALVFHGAAQRYHTTHLMGLTVMREDRLTGRVDMCTAADRNSPLVCSSLSGRAK